MIRCGRCHENKAETEFAAKPENKSGISGRCRECDAVAAEQERKRVEARTRWHRHNGTTPYFANQGTSFDEWRRKHGCERKTDKSKRQSAEPWWDNPKFRTPKAEPKPEATVQLQAGQVWLGQGRVIEATP